MAGAKLYPKAARVTSITVNGVTLPVSHFKWNGHCDLIPVVAFTSGGKTEYANGPTSGTFSCGGIWSRIFNPNGSGISPGKQVTLVVNLDNGAVAEDDDAWVEDFDASGDSTGPQEYEISLKMNWAFTDFANNIVEPI